jgi:xanthine dehydrogenase accessory factor
MQEDLLTLAAELLARREPFALATVVRCERPTSAKPGAKALIRVDGRVSGWIGGSCAEPVTVREALDAMRVGQPRLIALVGEGATDRPGREGVREHAMPCHSGGSLEIYIEPVLPKPQLVLVGSGPVVETLAGLATTAGLAVVLVERAATARAVPAGSVVVPDLTRVTVTPETGIVVATHGRFDEDALEQALRSDAVYVSLVASPKRAAAVVEALRARGVPVASLARLKAPAGLDLGAVTPEEIAVSILAEVIRARRTERPTAAPATPTPAATSATVAVDPVCGMTVSIAGARYTSDAGGPRAYFCCAGCQQRFEHDPARFGLGTRS